eukprot:5933375-Pyramimonas_sp.AAC.1
MENRSRPSCVIATLSFHFLRSLNMRVTRVLGARAGVPRAFSIPAVHKEQSLGARAADSLRTRQREVKTHRAQARAN